jgi:hypothetical protein
MSGVLLIDQNEASMIVTKYTSDDLKKLPLRAIVALAARCARRIAPLALFPDDRGEAPRLKVAIDNAIQLAERFANGLPCPNLESIVQEVEACQTLAGGEFVRESAVHAIVLAAQTTATASRALDLRGLPGEPHVFAAAKPNPFPHLADLTADLAARDAFTAALTAADADGHSDDFVKRAVADYQEMLRLDLGSYPQAGKAIDPSSKGPLGPLG